MGSARTDRSDAWRDRITLGALGAAAALFIGWLILRSAPSHVDPLAAVPVDSFLVATVDFAALARSPLGGALVGDGGARAGSLLDVTGVDTITATCGFDPLHHVRAVAVAVPEGGENGDFGVAASEDLSRDALAACTKALVAKRGGEANERRVGTFTVISDSHGGRDAEVAFRDGGPLLVGRGAWLTKMIDAVEGRTPSVAGAGGEHRELRADLAKRDLDAQAIEITATLPAAVRSRILGEMGGTSDRPNPVMASVLAVSRAVIGLHAGAANDDTRIAAELRCETEPACDEVSKVILHARLGWSGNLGYRLFGLGALIDNLQVRREGTTLIVQTRAPAEDLARMLDKALNAPPRPKAPPAAPPAPPSAPASAAGSNGGSRGDGGT
ncbi:MAG TPA: hypothetical protein VGI39_12725 [Polyangiaceae bacterium]|jgi:hypothetical protein